MYIDSSDVTEIFSFTMFNYTSTHLFIILNLYRTVYTLLTTLETDSRREQPQDSP